MRAPAFLLLAGLALTGRLAGADVPPTAAQLEFFEKEVRPILAENCFECHGPKKQKSGLRLDAKAFVLKGGEVGPVVVSGKPEQSRLILAINHAKRKDVEAMPSEDKKLSAKEIAALTEWVRQGLPWPATGQPEIADPRKHWAFQPVTNPPAPKVAAADRARNDVDRFLLAQLEGAGLSLSPEAPKETLIRRAYFALWGLPPTAEEIERFAADRDPLAYDKLVDRLMAAPAYGERWGRHWLDVARYADTKGYVFEEERRYAYAYTYRDWVVGAFNRDLPYDRFLKLQLAADALVAGDDTRDLAALGFLTLGRRFLNNQQDIIDDRIDVVMRGTQALTMGCARCHDHKSDPLPSTDYYSLYAIFNSSEEPKDKPLLKPFTPTKDSEEFERELAAKEAKVVEFRTSRREGSFSAAKTTAYLGILRRSLTDAKLDEAQEAKRLGLYPAIFTAWKKTLKARLVAHDPQFGLWARLTSTPEEGFKAKLAAELLAKKADAPIDPVLAEALAKKPPTKFDELLAAYGELLASARGNAAPNLKPWRDLIEAPNGPTAPTAESLVGSYVVADAQKHRALIREVEAFKASPKSPPRAMALVDKAQAVNGVVFLRGNPGRPGKNVTRHYLEILSPGGTPTDFKQGSGRLELANAIANATNPLTARVFVNRTWDQVFGRPLVETPSDFGVRTAAPTHPALLDALASRFIADNWSTKKLIRTLVTSAAFRQSSETNAAGAAKDPENRLLWRMNRRRADFETMRDSILAVSGQLEPKVGGQPFDLVANFGTPRRTLYALIDRQNLPAVFRTFDFANPDYHVARRNQTTTPQQALWMMNHPFARQQADALAAKLTTGPDEQKARALYRTILGREPQPSETKQALAYVAEVRQAPAPANWLNGIGGYDPKTKQVTFTEMKVLNKDRLSPTEKFPDPVAGHAMLTAKGGHPGNDAQHAVIRRWSAGGGGEFRIDGELKVASAQSQGVRARIVSAQRGLLGEWTCNGGGAVNVTLEKALIAPGDTVDFILDDLNGPNSDGFTWAPVIKDARTGEVIDAAAGGFLRKAAPQSPWSSLAQVLFASNEFNFAE